MILYWHKQIKRIATISKAQTDKCCTICATIKSQQQLSDAPFYLRWLNQPVSKNERRPSSEIIESFPTLEPSLNIFKTEERTNIIHDLFSQPAVLQVKTIHLYLVGVAHKANATSSGCITTAPNRTSRKATIISLQATCCTLITKIRQFHHPNSLTSIVLNPHNKIPTGVQNLFYCSRWVWFNRTLRKEFSYKQH